MTRVSAQPDAATAYPLSQPQGFCIQRLLAPDAEVNSESDLFYHAKGQVDYDTERRAYLVAADSTVRFDGYFNVLPAHLFDFAGLDVVLDVTGEGDVLVEVILARIGYSWERLAGARLTLAAGVPARLRLPRGVFDGVAFVRVVAKTDAVIATADYRVLAAPLVEASITLAITGSAPDAGLALEPRLRAYLDGNADIAERLSLLAIDGLDADGKALGDAATFARAFARVRQQAGSTHVLFADDDAIFFPESLRRTLALLSFSRTPNLAVAGAMISAAYKWQAWENGALFGRRDTPVDDGRDLRDFDTVLALSHGQTPRQPARYGGSWFFCLPLASLPQQPFPYVERGDGGYFSLGRDLAIVTMAGVAAHRPAKAASTALDALPLAEGFCLQRLLTPDAQVNSEIELFFHADGDVSYNTKRRAYTIGARSTIRFDSYFNVFPAHLYDLDDMDVVLDISGEGEVFAEVMLARFGHSWERLACAQLTLQPGLPARIKLPRNTFNGVAFLNIRASTDAVITGADYRVLAPPRVDASVTLVITTFRRRDSIMATAARLQTYVESNPDIAEKLSLLVIDNGDELDAVPFEHGEVVRNRNLGGAGGFTRGLKKVMDEKRSTHVLFSDDDATFFPESLRRTLALMRYTKTPNLAVAGAMITEAHKWRMWENGATFNRRCAPLDNGRDLRRFDEVLAMSQGQPRGLANKYGGWWYFCFPIASVTQLPFPFFVRGDDSFFSLANNFDIVTMPGVVAHQEDFFSKQSPLTVYLDFRYHMVHHLTFDRLKLSKKSFIKMVRFFFFRFNNSYHYESAAAVNLAIEDLLAGKEFWAANADMADRRRQIGEMTVNERIRVGCPFDHSQVTPHAPGRNTRRFVSIVRWLTNNGHRLPDWFFHKKGVIFPLDVRAIEHDSYLRPFTVTIDLASSRGYVSTIDRQAYFANRARFQALQKQLEQRYDELRDHYHAASAELTSGEAWEERFTGGK